MATDDGGSTIVGYIVLIRQRDQVTYAPDLLSCNTTTNLSCIIAVDVLRSLPYDLVWGSEIFAKVIAFN
jgi:hypothetical protein